MNYPLAATLALIGGFVALTAYPLLAHSESLGLTAFDNGGVAMHCGDIKMLPTAIDELVGKGFKVLAFDADQTKAILAQFNATDPVTAWQADKLYAARWSYGVYALITLGDKVCVTDKMIENESFDRMIETALGVSA